jgi:hypothetical protein
MKTALLFMTHVWCRDIEEQFEKLSSVPAIAAWLLLDSRTPELKYLLSRYPNCHVFEVAALFRLPYSKIPTPELIGHGHLAVLDFFLSHPDYDFYWFIEYDVRYTGTWDSFFGPVRELDHDFVTTHIRWFAEEPDWDFWPTFGHGAERVPNEQLLRSFNVIYRISNRALTFLDNILRDGWQGHHETLIITLLHRNGFKLLDLGGNGSFVSPQARNAVYTSKGYRSGWLSPLGTLRWRPSRTRPGLRKNKIYHPVKPKSVIEPAGQRRDAYRQWLTEMRRDITARF